MNLTHDEQGPMQSWNFWRAWKRCLSGLKKRKEIIPSLLVNIIRRWVNIVARVKNLFSDIRICTLKFQRLDYRISFPLGDWRNNNNRNNKGEYIFIPKTNYETSCRFFYFFFYLVIGTTGYKSIFKMLHRMTENKSWKVYSLEFPCYSRNLGMFLL